MVRLRINRSAPFSRTPCSSATRLLSLRSFVLLFEIHDPTVLPLFGAAVPSFLAGCDDADLQEHIDDTLQPNNGRFVYMVPKGCVEGTAWLDLSDSVVGGFNVKRKGLLAEVGGGDAGGGTDVACVSFGQPAMIRCDFLTHPLTFPLTSHSLPTHLLPPSLPPSFPPSLPPSLQRNQETKLRRGGGEGIGDRRDGLFGRIQRRGGRVESSLW
jgi:hypothetical protein